MLFFERDAELKTAAECMGHFPGHAQKEMDPHRKVRRVEQGTPPLPKPLTHPGELVCPARGSGYGRDSELTEPLQVSHDAVGPGELQRHVHAPEPFRSERLAIGILGALDHAVDDVSSLLSEGRYRGAHLAGPDDGNLHQSLPKNSRCSRRTTSG